MHVYRIHACVWDTCDVCRTGMINGCALTWSVSFVLACVRPTIMVAYSTLLCCFAHRFGLCYFAHWVVCLSQKQWLPLAFGCVVLLIALSCFVFYRSMKRLSSQMYIRTNVCVCVCLSVCKPWWITTPMSVCLSVWWITAPVSVCPSVRLWAVIHLYTGI